MASYGVAEAKNKFTQLLERVEAGERITITRHGKPVAEIASAPVDAAPRMTLEERRARLAQFAAERDARPPLGMSAAALVRAMRDGDPE